jgi:hypothetical protein
MAACQRAVFGPNGVRSRRGSSTRGPRSVPERSGLWSALKIARPSVQEAKGFLIGGNDFLDASDEPLRVRKALAREFPHLADSRISDGIFHISTYFSLKRVTLPFSSRRLRKIVVNNYQQT